MVAKSTPSTSSTMEYDKCIQKIECLEDAKNIIQNLLLKGLITAKDISESTKLTTSECNGNNNKVSEGASKTTRNVKTAENKDQTEPKKPTPKKRKSADKTSKKKKSKQKKKEYRRRKIALVLAYNGTTHSGFTETLGLETHDNSIEHHLFKALLKTCLIEDRSTCNYSRSGRTDKGVSAHGQVIALTMRSSIPLQCTNDTTSKVNEGSESEDNTLKLPKNSYDEIEINGRKYKELDYPHILNNLLPDTIRVLGWVPVSTKFSARFSASGRHYKYFFVNDSSTFFDNSYDTNKMNSGLEKIIGNHDFRNMCKINAMEVTNFEREMVSARVMIGDDPYRKGNLSSTIDEPKNSSSATTEVCYMDIQGQAFLWHQIRYISAIMFMIGKGFEKTSVINFLLDVKNNTARPHYEMASDLPLVLHTCMYDNVKFGYSVQNLVRVTQLWQDQYEKAMIEAEKLKSGIISLKKEAKIKLGDLKHYMAVKQIPNKGAGSKRKVEDIENDEGQERWFPAKFQSKDGVKDSTVLLTWGEAVDILNPFFKHLSTTQHMPVSKRSVGASYEQKMKHIYNTPKKFEKYDKDVLQKQALNNKDETDFFYTEMKSYGGSAYGEDVDGDAMMS